MNGWAMNFIYTIMIIILIEYITPDNKYEKYIKLVSSIMFITSLLVPIYNFINNENYDVSVYQNMLSLDTKRLEFDNTKSEEYILKQYKTSIINDIKNTLNYKVGSDGRYDVDIEIDETDENYGQILNVNISSDKEKNLIKKVIKDFYFIEDRNINIVP